MVLASPDVRVGRCRRGTFGDRPYCDIMTFQGSRGLAPLEKERALAPGMKPTTGWEEKTPSFLSRVGDAYALALQIYDDPQRYSRGARITEARFQTS